MKNGITFFMLATMILISCNDKTELQLSHNQTLVVYPNPVANDAHIIVNNQSNQRYALKVFDTKGKIILEDDDVQGTQEYSLQLTDKPVGTYQVILNTDKGVVSFKLIKI